MRAAALLLMTLAAAQAEISPVHVSVDRQFADASTVAIGTCLAVRVRDPGEPAERNGRLVPRDYVADYSLFRVYKGAASMKLAVLFPQRNPDWGPPSCPSGAVLLFLKGAASNDLFPLVDEFFGIRYFPGQPPRTDDKTGGLDRLESDAASFLTSDDPATVAAAIMLLSDFDQLSKTTISSLEGTTAKPDRNASILRLEILARNNPDKYFDELARHVPDILTSDQPLITVRFCEAVERAASPQRLDALEAVVSGIAGDTPVRVCAMSAIRRMKEPRTVPFLVKEVDDPNVDVAYLAVIALADITDKNGDFGPGMRLFRTNPEKYRSVWRQWWQQDGSHQF